MQIRGKKGQTVVEVLLVMPVFFLMLFFVMELANIAFHSIISHHAAYEFARIGGLVGVTKQGGKTDKQRIEQKLRQYSQQMFKGRNMGYTFKTRVVVTSKGDPQTKGHVNEDVEVTVTYPVRLIFPGTSWILADNPKKDGIRRVYAKVRMPIERPTLN